jgi:hypothetical protein
VRALLAICCQRVKKISVLEAHQRVERTAAYDRPLGFDSLTVAIEAL